MPLGGEFFQYNYMAGWLAGEFKDVIYMLICHQILITKVLSSPANCSVTAALAIIISIVTDIFLDSICIIADIDV